MENRINITYHNIEEFFGMGGPYLGDVYLEGRKLDGKFLADNWIYSDDKKYLLLSKFNGESEVMHNILRLIPDTQTTREFRIVVLELETGKIYQSAPIDNALYITKMQNDEIFYHQAFHDQLPRFARSIVFNTNTFLSLKQSYCSK